MMMTEDAEINTTLHNTAGSYQKGVEVVVTSPNNVVMASDLDQRDMSANDDREDYNSRERDDDGIADARKEDIEVGITDDVVPSVLCGAQFYSGTAIIPHAGDEVTRTPVAEVKDKGNEQKSTFIIEELPNATEQQKATTENIPTWMDITSWLQGPVPTNGSSLVTENNGPTLPSWLSWLDPEPEIPATNQTKSSVITTIPTDSTDGVTILSNYTKSDAEVPSNANRSSENVSTPESNNHVADDDESTKTDASTISNSEKLFGELASIPSHKDEFEDEPDTESLDVSTRYSNTASLVERGAQEIQLRSTRGGRTTNSSRVIKKDSNTENRRRLLLNELKSTINTYSRYDVKVANVSIALAELLDESGEYDQAIKLFRDAIAIYSSKLGDDHATTIAARDQFAKVLENANMYDEAINTFYLVTVMRRAIQGEKDPSAADSLVSIARVLRKKGDYTQSIKELKRALKVYRESLGDAHAKVSQTVDEIASLYVTIGDFEKSAAILEEVVKLKAATMGVKSNDVAQTLLSLATTYECSEQFSKAMKSLKKAYKVFTEIGGYSSADSTNALNRIAHLYEAIGDNNRASIAYLGVLRGRKINYGEDHLLVGETYYFLGRTLHETGQNDKALKCMKEALPIYIGKGVEVSDVETIADIMHEMASLHKEKGQLTDAVRILQQELGVRRKVGQPEFPMVARTLNFLGVVEYEMKNFSKALKYLVEALTIFQDKGEQSIDCAEVLFNAGLVFEVTKNNSRALEAFDEAARIFKNHGYKENHPHLVKCYYKIEKIQNLLNKSTKRGRS